MSNPQNGAARNQMSEFERQCYDWGWQDNEERIIKLLEANEDIGWIEMPTDDLVALIKGEQK